MSAVSGVRRAIKELVDGTIRVQVDIDPRYRKAFFDLFPEIDMPVALAPLVGGFESDPPAGKEPPPAADHAPGGATPKAHHPKAPQRLSQYAALLCKNPTFQRFAEAHDPVGWGRAREAAAAAHGSGATREDAAAYWMRADLRIDSRGALDLNDVAATRFHILREDYRYWCVENGAEA